MIRKSEIPNFFSSNNLPKCQNIWHCSFLYPPLLQLNCLLEYEKTPQYEARKQAYFPPDVEEIQSSKALIYHSAQGKT